jgi:CheY-like chemotaxis protein
MSDEKIRVLIVDDSRDMRMILSRLLCYAAPDVEVVASASNGAEGVKQTKAHQPDIVLMDFNLPDIDGIAATRIISREVPLSQVIMMTAGGELECHQRSRSAGARQLLIKPIDSEELISAIRTIHGRGNGTG